MSDPKRQPTAEAGYNHILAESPRDARLFLWSVRIVTAAGIATLYIFVFAVLWPLLGLFRGVWVGTGSYLLRIGLCPLPPFVILLLAASLNRRLARKYGFAKE